MDMTAHILDGKEYEIDKDKSNDIQVDAGDIIDNDTIEYLDCNDIDQHIIPAEDEYNDINISQDDGVVFIDLENEVDVLTIEKVYRLQSVLLNLLTTQ